MCAWIETDAKGKRRIKGEGKTNEEEKNASLGQPRWRGGGGRELVSFFLISCIITAITLGYRQLLSRSCVFLGLSLTRRERFVEINLARRMYHTSYVICVNILLYYESVHGCRVCRAFRL